MPLTFTPNDTCHSVEVMYAHTNPKNEDAAPLVAENVHAYILANADRFDNEIRYDRDFDYDYFGL